MNASAISPMQPTRAALPIDLRALEAAREIRAQRKVESNADQIRRECRSFAGFVRHAWKVLEPRAELVWSWHLTAICEHLEAVTRGEITRLLINVPPGSMKSLLVSVLWNAWEWGPMGMRDMRYLTTSFNDKPVKRDMGKTIKLLQSRWFKTLWPEVVLNRAAVMSFGNTDTGSREGVAFGSLTSQRGDRLIVDDPHSTKTAESDTERAETTRQFREGALDRINDPDKSAIIVIMQRLHMDDVSGVILHQMPEQGFVHLMIPMEFETARRCTTRLGVVQPDGSVKPWSDPRAVEGELMAPERWPVETVRRMEKGKGPYAWAGQFQQRPAPREGGLFNVDKLLGDHTVTKSPGGGFPFRGWDLAASLGQTAAWTAGVLLREANGLIYIEDVIRVRAEPFQVEETIAQAALDDGMSVKQSIPQDPAAGGVTAKHHLALKLAGQNFKFSPEKGDKTTRAIPIASQIDAGLVRMVKAPWNAEFIEELRNFPNGTFKDQVDALSRAYAEIVARPKKRFGLAAPIVGEHS